MEISATRTVRVSGYVVGLDGAPVLSPLVQLLGPGGTYTAAVDYTGHYQFGGVAPGTYNLRVSAPGMVRHSAAGLVVGPDGLAQNVALAPEARLFGSVSFVGGPPASGTLRVALVRRDGSAFGVGAPVVQGFNFSFDRLPPGTYDLALSFPNYRTQLLTSVEILPGQTLTLPPVTMTLDSSIGGSVTSTLPGGTVANLQVGVFDTSGTFLGAVSTNASGHYAFIDMAPGTYSLRVMNLREGVSTQVQVTVVAGDHLDNVALQITQGARIRGEVRQASTGNLIVGATVMAINSAGEVALAKTDGDGTYEFRQVAGNTYRVSLVAAGASHGGSQQVTVVGADDEIAVVDLVRDAGVARLSGQVRTLGGQGIANAGVFLFQNGSPSLAGYTDAYGQYELVLDITGTFDLYAVSDGASFTPINGVVVTAGANLSFDFIAGAAPMTINVSAPGGSGGIDMEVYQILGSAQLLVARRSLALSGWLLVGPTDAGHVSTASG